MKQLSAFLYYTFGVYAKSPMTNCFLSFPLGCSYHERHNYVEGNDHKHIHGSSIIGVKGSQEINQTLIYQTELKEFFNRLPKSSRISKTVFLKALK